MKKGKKKCPCRVSFPWEKATDVRKIERRKKNDLSKRGHKQSFFSQFSVGLGCAPQDFTRAIPGLYCKSRLETFSHLPFAFQRLIFLSMPRTHLFSTLAPPTGVIRPFPCSGVGSTHPADSTGGIQLVTEHPGAKRWCQHAQSCFACRSCLLLLPWPVKQPLGALVWVLGVTGTQR